MFTTAISKIILTIALLLALCSVAGADHTVLHTAATALSPGQFVQVGSLMTGLQLTVNPGFDILAGAPGPGYDAAQPAWDTATRKLYIETTEHGRAGDPFFCPHDYPNYPHGCWKPLWIYDDATNTWTVNGPNPIHAVGSTPAEGVHVWGHIAYDNVNKTIYVKNHGGGTLTTWWEFFRYCATNSLASYCASQLGQWQQITGLSPNNGSIFGQMGWHPTLNGGTLLMFDAIGSSDSCGALWGYTEGQGWRVVDAGTSPACKYPIITGTIATLHPATRSTSKDVVIFGPTGASGLQWWRINGSGSIVALDTAPCVFTTTNGTPDQTTGVETGGFGQVVEDPNTGDIIFIGCTNAGKMYRLNPTGSSGNQWSPMHASLNGVNQICNVNRNAIYACGFDFYATPISTYGVIGFWKFRGNLTAEYWLYKPSATAGDTTPPSSVIVTAPAAKATVSGTLTPVSATATDDVGVAGVQFKLDGNNLGVEDTTSPYSIIWDTTGVANGSHTLSAVARDDANNTATSSGVTVTVSNAAGGSDYDTRCNAAVAAGGRCIPFDSASEISCLLWGCNTGLDLGFNGGHTPPSIDTSVKASGTGSIKFAVESQSPANGSGAYFANFSSDLSKRYGAGQTFYIQWRQRFSPEMFSTIYYEDAFGTRTNGWKTSITTAGDHTGTCTAAESASGDCQDQQGVAAFKSCTFIDLPTQNVGQRGFLQAYQSCYGSSSRPGAYYGFQRNYPSGTIDWGCNPDCYLQDAAPTPFCLYSQGPEHGGKGYFPPQGGCVAFVANEWMTFKLKFAIGQRGSNGVVGASPNDEWVGSNFSAWIAREGQPSVQVFDFGPFNLSAGSTALDERFGKIYLQPYITNKDPNQIHPTAYTWYDELIISPNDIADPGAGTATPPTAPSGFKLK